MHKDDLVNAILRKRFTTVIFDVDGVLADFATHAAALFGQTTEHLYDDGLADSLGVSHKEFADKLKEAGEDFWASLPVLDYGMYVYKSLVWHCQDVFICTSPMIDNPACCSGKYIWLHKHFGPKFKNFSISSEKYRLAFPDCCLIDDTTLNVDAFRAVRQGNALLWRGEETQLIWR